MKQRILTTLFFILFYFAAAARPARPGVVTFYQPDGTSFPGMMRGDEFYKIRTTVDGHAVIQGEDGWWYYAQFNASGERIRSDYRVGSNVPGSVLFESSNIPYGKLAENARSKRQTFISDRQPLMKRIMQHNQVQTKAGGETVIKRGIIILAEFSDVKFEFKKENFINLLTKDGYNYNGATGSAMQYFNDQFEGRFQFEFEVSDIITLQNNRKYYGGNDRNGDDKNPAQMVKDACEAADAKIDFSQYDQDGDGEIDNVFIFFAGEDESEGFDEECIWSHAWWVKDGGGIRCSLDGKVLNSYACTSELSLQSNGRSTDMTGIGTFCHEYSHTLGLPDLYDTDYDSEGGWSAGVWLSTSLMDGGNQNNINNTPPYYNAIEREILGLAEPILLEKDGAYTLRPVQNNVFYRLNADTEGEYYLFECRGKSGWDKYIGGNGMLVYHIDKSDKYLSKWEGKNTVNAVLSHQCADLIEADGRTDEITEGTYQTAFKNISGVFFPYNSTNSLTPDSTPGLMYWSGKKGKISITNIQRDGENITFNVIGHSGTTTPPAVMSSRSESFMDAAIISFESDRAYEGEATVTWGRTGENETQTTTVKPYEPGKYAIILEGLLPGNKTYTENIHFSIDDISGKSTSISFMTTKAPKVSWPYIYLGKNKSTSDGIFEKSTKVALRTYNTSTAEGVTWTLNENDIEPGADGYYTIQEGGVLKAYVHWKDGSMDIIEKQLNVSDNE